MDRLKVVIADDEKDAIDVLTVLLEKTGMVSAAIPVLDPTEIESTIHRCRPDALFLDIEMPGMDGLKVVKNIRAYDQELPIIIVSAYEKYVPEAIKLHVYSYLTKPVPRDELKDLLQRLLDTRPADLSLPKFRLPLQDGYVFLDYEDILTLEADGNYTTIKTTAGEEYLSSYNLGRLHSSLAPEQFLRVSRNLVLNGKYLHRLNRKERTCELRAGGRTVEVAVSRAFCSSFNNPVGS